MTVQQLIVQLQDCDRAAKVLIFVNPIEGSVRKTGEPTKAEWKPVLHIVNLGQNIYLYDETY